MFPRSIRNLIDFFTRLPGIGPKTAERLVFFILKQPTVFSQNFADALRAASQDLDKCQTCHNFADSNPCAICRDPSRDQSLLCLVAEQPDVAIIEKTKTYHGLYHVLGGLINQVDGITPSDLELKSLKERLANQPAVKEVIIALSPTSEGETTSLYLEKNILPKNLKLTKLARGIPVGADIEYTDMTTLTSALNNRTEVNKNPGN